MATNRDFVFGADGELLPSDSTVAADRRKEQAPAPKKPPTKTAAKAPIVTKEQMRKAGFDNLRDYLNAQRGLTRRGEKPATKDDAKKRDDAAFAKEDARSKTARAVAGDSDARQRDAAEDRRRLAPIAAQGQRDRMASGSRRAAAAKRKKVSGLAKGGSVRSVRGYGAARTPNKKM